MFLRTFLYKRGNWPFFSHISFLPWDKKALNVLMLGHRTKAVISKQPSSSFRRTARPFFALSLSGISTRRAKSGELTFFCSGLCLLRTTVAASCQDVMPWLLFLLGLPGRTCLISKVHYCHTHIAHQWSGYCKYNAAMEWFFSKCFQKPLVFGQENELTSACLI